MEYSNNQNSHSLAWSILNLVHSLICVVLLPISLASFLFSFYRKFKISFILNIMVSILLIIFDILIATGLINVIIFWDDREKKLHYDFNLIIYL